MSAALELMKAVECLDVTAKVANDIKAKAIAVIEEARDDALWRECLENGGVDNWEWYGDSLTLYWEAQER